MAFVNSLHDYNHRAKTNFTEPTEFKHHNYDALTSFLQDVEKKCSHIMRLYSVGRSVQQRELWVMEVTDHPGQHEPGKTGSDISLSLFLSVCLSLSLCVSVGLSLSLSLPLSLSLSLSLSLPLSVSLSFSPHPPPLSLCSPAPISLFHHLSLSVPPSLSPPLPSSPSLSISHCVSLFFCFFVVALLVFGISGTFLFYGLIGVCVGMETSISQMHQLVFCFTDSPKSHVAQ